MTDEDWRIVTSSTLARLEVHCENLALRYEELDQRAKDAAIAKTIAQQNAMCLDAQSQKITAIEEHLMAHDAASESIMEYAKVLVDLAEQDVAWRRVRRQILSAAKWITGTAAGLMLLYQLIVHGDQAVQEILAAVDKAVMLVR